MSILSPVFFLALSLHAQPTPAWRLTRSDHFELYSQGNDDAAARSALIWFEQLRAFYLQKTGLDPQTLRPVRVIEFRSTREYQSYHVGSASDAHFIGTESRDYIVMSADAGEFATAAHEYAHSILHAAGLQFPPWFSEGLAEFFSNVRMNGPGWTLGGDLPARSQTLQRHAWMSLPELTALPATSPIRDNRDTAGVFYAQSWALVDMLVLAPDYAPHFPALIEALNASTPGAQALASIYGKSLDAITRDLRSWTAVKHSPIPLPGIQLGKLAAPISEPLSPNQERSLMAEILAASGDLERAEAIYRALPPDAAVFAALGAIALRKGDKDGAREQWKRAIDAGIADAMLCYQYAALAEMAGVPEDELRPALERAIKLKPDFDDARYHLALVEKNSGHYDAALTHLRAIHTVAPARAYNYWIAITDSLLELDRRDEARSASKQALAHAATASQRAYATQLAYFADTDLAVQFTNGENGRVEMATTRVPHKTADWNPFIEPGDKMRHAEGALRKIDCSGARTRFVIDTSDGPVTLEIPDPSRVQMRNAPPEFTCGPQHATKVAVDYAVVPGKPEGLIRGMQFK